MINVTKVFSNFLLLSSYLILGSCSTSGNAEMVNTVGGIAAEIFSKDMNARDAEFTRKIGYNAGKVLRVIDGSQDSDAIIASEFDAQLVNGKKLSSDKRMAYHLNSIAQKLARHAPESSFIFKVRLINSGDPNAFTPGGGLIVITSSLLGLLQNEAQISTVIAHEMGHIVKRHTKQQSLAQLTAQLGWTAIDTYKPSLLGGAERRAASFGTKATLQTFSRQQELEADRVALDILAKAGYSLHEAPIVFSKLAQIGKNPNSGLANLLNSHPPSEARNHQMRTLIKNRYAAQANKGGLVNTPTYENLSRRYRK